MINRETLRHLMIEAGLWKGRSRKKARIHQSRQRRSCFGELVQIDGSHHDWFEGRGPRCCLIVFIDDATSRLVGLGFFEGETTKAYMEVARAQFRKYGRPIAYYSDKDSVFTVNREQCVDRLLKDTQFQRAMRTLHIELINAHSPQAKGRVERANKTLQDRLVKELRLRDISDIATANAYLPEFMEEYNARFSIEAFDGTDKHRPLLQNEGELSRILSIHATRKLTKNLEFSFENIIYQIVTETTGYRLRGKEVTIIQHLGGTMEVLCDETSLGYKIINKDNRLSNIETKMLNVVMDQLIMGESIALSTDSPRPSARAPLYRAPPRAWAGEVRG